LRGCAARPGPFLLTLGPSLPGPVSRDPLEWPGYRDALRSSIDAAGAEESVTVHDGRCGAHDVVVARFHFGVLGGSMGEASGRRLVLATDRACSRDVPLVTLVVSGGARIQEGLASLVQMRSVAGAVARLRRSGVPHVCVLEHPVTGGVWASLAASADVLIARADALVAFAGSRLRGADGAADTAAFRAEGKLAGGWVDEVVGEDELDEVLEAWVGLVAERPRSPVSCEPPRALGRGPTGPGWASVQAARDPARPHARAYLDDHFDRWRTLTGDRVGGVDPGTLCGLASRAGRTVAFVAQSGTATRPSGYRAAQRLLRLAERLALPVLTLIDTPGAAADAAAEEAGVGPAIAETLVCMASLTVPVTSVVIGEGGSGGAMALAAEGRTWMAPDSYFAVIAPEAAAAILHRDPSRAREVAGRLHLSPAEVVEAGIAVGVLDAPPEGTRVAARC